MDDSYNQNQGYVPPQNPELNQGYPPQEGKIF